MLRITIFFLTTFFLLAGCSATKNRSSTDISGDNKYDSEFPSKSVSDELSYISQTVKKLDILAFYATYFFPPNSHVTRDMVNDSILNRYSSSKIISHETVSGTATVIYNSNNTVGLLTCAHVVDFNDSIFSHYEDIDLYGTSETEKYVQSVSIKIKQQNHISKLPPGEKTEVAAIDMDKDIAILVKKLNTGYEDELEKISILNYPIGNVNDMQWGSIVYIMGFPHGKLMVTRAIVSLNDKLKNGMFATDALYNKGISGSPVFAVRDGIPNFELVGMAASSAAETSKIIIPGNDTPHNIMLPYNGTVFVDNKKLISYGVTYSVSINEIISFIDLNEELLSKYGLEVNTFFK